MSQRSLLVLGMSTYQVETVHTARRLGYRIVGSDNVPDNPGHTLVDRSYPVDTTDQEGILSVARRENVAGVIAPCTDVAVPTAAYVARRLGLVGPPLAAAEVVCDKLAFRAYLKTNGFRVPAFHSLPAPAGLPAALFDGRPWIVKPDRSSGSKGVFIVRSRAELDERLPETLSFSPTGRAVLEEFIDGRQGTCEGVVQDGRVALACFLDRQTVAPPYVATCGHRVPTTLPARAQQRVAGELERLWQRLGVTDAVFDCDFILDGEAVYLLEVSPRLGGNCIAALLWKASGFHFTEFAVRLACGERPQAPRELTIRPMAVLILGSPWSGRLRYDEEAAESLARADWVDSLTMDLRAGSPVRAFVNGRHRVGECFVRGSSYDDVIAKGGEVLRRLQITAH